MTQGTHLIAASYDLTISVTDLSLDTSSGAAPTKFSLQNAQANKIIAINKTRFVVASNPFIFLFDRTVKSTKPLQTFQGHQSNVTDLCYDDQFLYSCSEDKTWHKWDFSKSRSISVVNNGNCLNTMTLLNKNSQIATGNDRGKIDVYNLADNSNIASKKIASCPIRSIAECGENGPLIVGAQDGKVYIVKIDGPEISILNTFEAHKAILTRVTPSPNGKLFATTSADSTTAVWDIDTCQLVAKLEDPAQTRWVWDAKFFSDSTHIATGGTDKICRIWNIIDKKPLRTIEWHQKGVTCLTLI